MDYKTFMSLHRKGKLFLPREQFKNPLPSSTDPTQDIPIKKLQMAANGIPVNVSMRKDLYYTNRGTETLCTIDSRNNDKFDVAGELQAREQNVNKTINKVKKLN